MRKLVIIATALSMVLPLPILAKEEMGKELSPQNVQSEPMVLETREDEDPLCIFHMTCEEGEEEFYIYRFRIGTEVQFPLLPKDYVNLFPSDILESYDFLDLPNLQETDFTTNKDKKINIKATPRSSSSITQLDSNFPVLFQVTYTGHGWAQTTFLSSKVSL